MVLASYLPPPPLGPWAEMFWGRSWALARGEWGRGEVSQGRWQGGPVKAPWRITSTTQHRFLQGISLSPFHSNLLSSWALVVLTSLLLPRPHPGLEPGKGLHTPNRVTAPRTDSWPSQEEVFSLARQASWDSWTGSGPLLPPGEGCRGAHGAEQWRPNLDSIPRSQVPTTSEANSIRPGLFIYMSSNISLFFPQIVIRFYFLSITFFF